MSDENPKERSSPWMTIFLGIGLCAILASIILPMTAPKPRVATITKCKNHLKQLGLAMFSYYADGTKLHLPIITDTQVAADHGGLGFEVYMLSCPAKRQDLSTHYVWNPKLSGGTFAEWNNPNSPLIWDATPHKINNKVSVLFGDGHVEEITPERLKELTR